MNLQRFFSSVALFGFRHWKVNAILVVCLVAISYPVLRSLKFESIIPGLESARDPQSRFFAANMERFGESGPFVIHLSYGGVDLPTANRFTDKLAEELRSWKDILYVDAKVYDENSRRLQAVMLRAALVNMDTESIQAFAAKFSPEGMERELRKTRRKLIAAEDPALREQVAADVLNIGEVVRTYFQSRMGNLNLNAVSEYFDAAGHDSRLVFVQPAGTVDDTDYCAALMARIDSLVQNLKALLPGAAPVRISYAGKYAISAEAAQALKLEMKHITLLAAGLLLLIVWIAFRRIRVVGICFIPLAVSLLAVSLIAALFFSPLNYVAISFAAVIIGLGIDLIVHCTARFYQLIETVSSPAEAVRKTLIDCGSPLVIGFSTTAAAFLCLSITDYRAIAQFGQLTSIGLIVSLVVSLLLFPTAIRILGPRKKGEFQPLRFRGFPERTYTFSLSKPGLALSIVGLLVVGGVLLARRFTFEMNLMKLLPQNVKALETARDIDRLYGASFTLNLQFVIQGDDLHQALAVQKALDGRLALLVENDQIASFEPPSLFLPYPTGDQSDMDSPSYFDTVIAENRPLFFDLLRKNGFKRDPRYEDYYDLLETASRVETLSVGKLLSDEDIGSRLRKHIAIEDEKVFLQTYIWPRSDLDNQGVIKEVFEELEDFPLLPGTSLHKLSILRVFDSINSRIRSDFIRVSALGLTMVVLFILIFFRRLSSTLLCILPVAAAVPVTLGFVVLARIPFTPAEIGTAALILGIGIDDAVHLVSRTWLQERRRMREVVAEIGPVLTLTSLTTMAGFGSLMIARNIVTFTLGAVITFGILACLIFTLLLIPAVHGIMKKN